jgi:hypothetical protein
MHYPSSSRFAVSSGLRTATSAFPVLSLPPDLSASAAGYATVLPVRVTRYHQPRVARDDGRRGVPRRGLSLLGWTVPTTTPEDRAEPATEVKHPPSFRFITPLSLRTPRLKGQRLSSSKTPGDSGCNVKTSHERRCFDIANTGKIRCVRLKDSAKSPTCCNSNVSHPPKRGSRALPAEARNSR